MENLNAEAIKNELEGLANYRTCPEYIKDALALINSQEQEKEKLGLLISEIEKEKQKLFDENKRLIEENERLRVDNEILKMPRATIFEIADAFDRGRKKGEADTVRKMQERLKAECNKYLLHSGITLMLHQHIDKIAKEMLEGVGDAGE